MRHITLSGIKYLTLLLTILAVACSGSHDDFDDDDSQNNNQVKNEVYGLSFSWDFTDDYPYERTYDIAFLNNKRVEFSATAHGTTGEQFGYMIGDYTISGDKVLFNFSGKGFQVSKSYVKPLSGTLIYDEYHNITGMEITLCYESFKGKITTSDLDFYLSDYKPTYTEPDYELKKLKEKDLLGTVWEVSYMGISKNLVILCRDHTMFNMGDSWSFDEKNQILNIKIKGSMHQFKVFSGSKEEFECEEEEDYVYNWSNVPVTDSSYIFANFINGYFKNDAGKTLSLPGLSGTAAPDLPQNTKRKIYETQEMIIDNFAGLKGTYHIHYEGQEWDISKFIPMAWNVQGGTIEISDPLNSYKDFRVSLTGKVNGEFRRITD